MEPIEINAGTYYLRALRSDDRVDDRPALADGGIADPDYIAQRARQWAEETHYSWAVCEPTTGEMLAEVGLDTGTAEVTGWARSGHDEALATAMSAVRRFAASVLG
ncbi:hypothetical protein FOS14_15565 [Skermania sp. ID1734]|uniref:hypothetical protein n=1 Tax=Skermania sp. ID1734 TaxID=2597516 RepID=UPI0011811B2C|nr:hypothetical protein [Skermania sp. ID1734]TSD97388.1 hypothetical protein FOS14_15565 [Skermania sp. ID1734]